MIFVGIGLSRIALELMDTPADVIDLSVTYMRIYFGGMPFFMLYNYGAAILRAVGDTKRPLLFLAAAGMANVVLDLLLVIVIPLGVAGVAIGTVTSQFISCILVLRCLYKSEGSLSAPAFEGHYQMDISETDFPGGDTGRNSEYGD